MDGKQITEQKKAMRRSAREAAARLPAEYCRAADRAIFGHVTGLLEYERAQTVFCYVGTELEIDTRPILEDALAKGKRVGVPLCVDKGIMEVRRIRSLEELEAGSYGIPEPPRTAELVAPEEIDLALVPCASCSMDGRRLGYGGGYYDRYLSRVTAPCCVLCRARLMRTDIPMDAHDRRMEMAVSEDGVIRCGKI